MPFEPNDERQTTMRFMMIEAFVQIDKKEIAPTPGIMNSAA